MIMRLRAAAVLALLALVAAARGDWQWMFVWLGVALVVDTIDGPLARLVGVATVLPRWSGERLDLADVIENDEATADCRIANTRSPSRPRSGPSHDGCLYRLARADLIHHYLGAGRQRLSPDHIVAENLG